MAERVVRQLIDDLDGSEIATGGGERIEFSLRGVDYQIDLGSSNIAKLDKALKPFVDAAVKVRSTRGRKPAKSVAGNVNGNGATSKEQLSAVRTWARKNGFDVSDRGRLRAEILEAFEAAH
jgi:hypothetical protein